MHGSCRFLCQTYISAHPDGRFAQQAKTQATKLRSDPAPYDAALRMGTEASFRAFLADCPGHNKDAAAWQALKGKEQEK
jgi:hypothetical protein